jgi:sugar O-acyltransferase (sialic acid O-acetyltransferase NeuD family)
MLTSNSMNEEPRPLIIWGAAGHAKVLAEFLPTAGFLVAAIFDNDPAIARSPLDGVPLYVGRQGFEQWRQSWGNRRVWGAVAIGGERGSTRLELQRYLSERGVNPATLVHPRAYRAESARVGPGAQILVHAVVGADAELGPACIVNTAATVDHECRLGEGVHVAPGAHLAGCVEVGRCAFIGIGACVLPRLRIGADAIVGAGAVVTKDVPEGTVVYGNPARVVRIREDCNGVG